METLEQELENEKIATGEEKVSKPKVRNQWNWVQLSGRIATEITKIVIKDQTVLQFPLLFETLRKTDKEGSHANFIEVEIWGKMAELYFAMLGKGLEIIVTGELFQQRWVGKDGKKAQRFSINAQALAITDQTFRPS